MRVELPRGTRDPTSRPPRMFRASAALPQLHVPVDRRQLDPPAAVAESSAQVTRVEPALNRDRKVGLEATVDRAHLEIGVRQLAVELHLDAAVDRGVVE